MRRTPVLLLLVLLTLSGLWGTGAAVAGGPTSVLLSVPGEGRVAALYHTGTDYQALDELVSTDAGAVSGQPPRVRAGETVTLTWLIHDVQVWRTDQVHLGGTGAPWVETRYVSDGGSMWDARPSWHRADTGLRKLLGDMLDGAGAAAVVEPGADPTAAEASAAPAPSSSAGGSGQRAPLMLAGSAGVGVLVGVMVTLVALRRRLRSEPRRMERPSTASDQLAWP
jgi:hypothetical protein